MQFELTDPSGVPTLVNTDWVAHWYPYRFEDEPANEAALHVLAEMAYVWVDPNGQSGLPETRTVVFMESFPEVVEAYRMHQKDPPNAIVTVRRSRRRTR